MADHFAPGVGAAGRTDAMRQPRAVAAWAFVQPRGRDLVLGTPLVAPRPRLSLLGDRHGGGRIAAVRPLSGRSAAGLWPPFMAKPSYSSLRSFSFAIRGSPPLSWRCASGSASVSDSPQTGQRPAQSGRQSGCAGNTRTRASLAQRLTLRSPSLT